MTIYFYSNCSCLSLSHMSDGILWMFLGSCKKEVELRIHFIGIYYNTVLCLQSLWYRAKWLLATQAEMAENVCRPSAAWQLALWLNRVSGHLNIKVKNQRPDPDTLQSLGPRSKLRKREKDAIARSKVYGLDCTPHHHPMPILKL